jgi:hypothetical protein
VPITGPGARQVAQSLRTGQELRAKGGKCGLFEPIGRLRAGILNR